MLGCNEPEFTSPIETASLPFICVADMKCPLDGSELVSDTYEAGVEVDQCTECKGVWLDHSELEKLQEAKEQDYSEDLAKLPNLVGQAYARSLANSKAEVNCPKCNELMERREHGYCSQILVDICCSCRGIWLDRGELRGLEIFFEKAQYDTKEIRSGFFGKMKDLFR
jgi:Zn-finger nucleic acid-binding protein